MSFSTLPNNTNERWYRDPGLRWNVFHWDVSEDLVCDLTTDDMSLLTGLQAMPAWQEFFRHPTGTLLGLYAAIFYLPSIPAAFLGDFLADRYGRRTPIIAGCFIVGVGSLLNSLASSIAMWLIGRGVIGFGGGMAKVAAPALIQEIAHPRLRPMLAACYWSFFHFGAILAAFMTFAGLYIEGDWSWRMPSMIQVIGPGTVFGVGFFLPESPRWLVKHRRENAALSVLAKYHANGYVEDELVQWEMEQIRHALAHEGSQASYLDFVKTPGNRRRLIIVLTLCVGLNWMGNGVISYYLSPVLKMVGVTRPVEITLINAGLAIWNLILALSASLSTERLGRRRLFFISGWGMLLSYSVITALSAQFSQKGVKAVGLAVIPVLFIYYGFYSIAWTPLPVMYASEILPFSLRTKGIALFTAFGTGANAFNQFVNATALSAIGWKYYLVYIGVIAAYLGIVHVLYAETRGLSIEEISKLFDKPEPEVAPEGKKGEWIAGFVVSTDASL
ncbi:hypothetical protein CspeluHIS016_0212130 [Cutaneotrichosporon spelunceum]|uniref:Major facilitator superfamily (MFS) profile domain-containing protein n=1 Tax=Cutaneotrichosporon spelunceum TaxID=1672016 RepID=A0AAD3TTC2_9TREE|nr:hypothetical protein CspeluHIS016_0212130 [Cutaneotrichosporon spelunceum]